MGAGIAQVAAVAGFEVVIRDVEDRFLVKGLAAIDQGLAKSVEKGKVTEDARRTARGRIRPTTRLDDAAHADIVIEAVPEDAALKKQVFAELDKKSAGHVIFATNTSAISITELAAATSSGSRLVGGCSALQLRGKISKPPQRAAIEPWLRFIGMVCNTAETSGGKRYA